MGILRSIDESLVSWETAPSLADMLDQSIAPVFVLIAAPLVGVLCRNTSLKVMAHLTRKTKATRDDIASGREVLIHLSRTVAPAIIYVFTPVVFAEISSSALGFTQRVCLIHILITFLSFINSLMRAAYSVYSGKEQPHGRPLKGMLQTAQVILWLIGVIIVVSILTDKPLLSLPTGPGASAAILILALRDSIMGFVSSVQLSVNDMLKVGDWTAMPKYGVGGTVIEATLNTVKIRNQDNTVTAVPPYLLASDSFQDQRGICKGNGCCVKRSISTDTNSVKFCIPEMLGEYRKIRLLKDYVEHTEVVMKEYNEKHHINNSILVSGRRQANLRIFRVYLTVYLKSLPDVNQEFVCIVRRLQPTNYGIPMELYFFCVIKDWVPYEGMQVDVFDHVLAITPEFDLQVFQLPSGRGFQRVLS